jgi:hypothetical protein
MLKLGGAFGFFVLASVMKIRFLISFVVLSLTLAVGCNAQDNSVYQQIENNFELAKLSKICPSELVQSKDIVFKNKTDECEKNQSICLSRCLAGSSDHCFGLANHFNIAETSEIYSRPLYAKSCMLGLASGCTNAAAGLQRYNGPHEAECYTDTFKKSCDLNDPWGCTMYAYNLVEGKGVLKSTDLALEALKGSCRFGESDPACSAALDLSSRILKGEFSGE